MLCPTRQPGRQRWRHRPFDALVQRGSSSMLVLGGAGLSPATTWSAASRWRSHHQAPAAAAADQIRAA